MKKISLIIMAFAAFSFFWVSCGKQELNNTPNSIENLTFKSYEAMFDAIAEQKPNIQNKNALYIDFTYDRTHTSLRIVSVNEREPDVFPLISNEARKSGASYLVTCCSDDGGNDLWEDSSNTSYGAASLVSDCLDGGGCATVCNGSIAYYPPQNKFIVSR